ncbi:unnamed protein product, partial [Ectocarpus sp. 12 AP-2014]
PWVSFSAPSLSVSSSPPLVAPLPPPAQASWPSPRCLSLFSQLPAVSLSAIPAPETFLSLQLSPLCESCSGVSVLGLARSGVPAGCGTSPSELDGADATDVTTNVTSHVSPSTISSKPFSLAMEWSTSQRQPLLPPVPSMSLLYYV